MKKDDEADTDNVNVDKNIDLELESIDDIIERIESLSYEGRRHIIAYLKAKMERKEKMKKE